MVRVKLRVNLANRICLRIALNRAGSAWHVFIGGRSNIIFKK